MVAFPIFFCDKIAQPAAMEVRLWRKRT